MNAYDQTIASLADGWCRHHRLWEVGDVPTLTLDAIADCAASDREWVERFARLRPAAVRDVALAIADRRAACIAARNLIGAAYGWSDQP